MLDVIIGVTIGARPVRRVRVGQSMGLVEVEAKLVATWGSYNIGRLIRERQSERPREKRQSGVVDIDSGLRQGVH